MKAESVADSSGNVLLWTFQQATIVPNLLSGNVHRAAWQYTPENCRIAYAWMAGKLAATGVNIGADAPVWCWQSCNGRCGAPPTVGTASLLLGSYDLEQGIVMLELAVPARLTLLSSYSAWNCFLDHVIEKKCLPRSERRGRWMFEQPLFKQKHIHDDIQAVIPFIDPGWVRRVCDVVVDGRDWNEAIDAIVR